MGPTKENHMDKKIEHEMEAVITYAALAADAKHPA